MAVISKKHNFIFFQNPRTGSTMLEKVLIEDFDGELFPKPLNNKEKMKFKHFTYWDLVVHGYMPKTEMSKYIKFTTVRNPYHKAVSDWLGGKEFFKKNRGKQSRKENILAKESSSLDSYLKVILLPFFPIGLRHSMAKYFPNVTFFILAKLYYFARIVSPRKFICDEMDVILKIENIEEDFDLFCREKAIIHKKKLPVVNKTYSISSSHGEYHSEFSLTLVSIMYADIIDMFAYKPPSLKNDV